MWLRFKKMVHDIVNNVPWVTPAEGQNADDLCAESAGLFFHEQFEDPNGEEKVIPEFDHLLRRRGQAATNPRYYAAPGQAETFVEEYTGYHLLADFPSAQFRNNRFAMFLPARNAINDPSLLVELLEEAKGDLTYGSPNNLTLSKQRPWHFRARIWHCGPDAWEDAKKISFLQDYYQCWHVTAWTRDKLLEGSLPNDYEDMPEFKPKPRERMFKAEVLLDWNLLGGSCLLFSFPMWDKDESSHDGKGSKLKKLFFPKEVIKAFERSPRYSEWLKHATYVRDLWLHKRGRGDMPCSPW